MKFPQYNIGKGVGTYYMLLQSSASYISLPNAIVGLFNLWALWELKIKNLVSWMNLPLFLLIACVIIFILLPVFHYVFMQASVVAFQNEQACKHENPVMKDLQKIKEKLGIKE